MRSFKAWPDDGRFARVFNRAHYGSVVLVLVLISGCATQQPRPTEHALCLEQLTAIPGDGEALSYQAQWRPQAHPYFVIPPPYSDFAVTELNTEAFSTWRAAIVRASWEELALHQLRRQNRTLSSSRACLVSRALELTANEWAVLSAEVAQRDLYQDWQRWLGLYPLSALVAQWRIRSAQRQWQQDYGGPFSESAVLYQAPARPQLSSSTVADWLAQSQQQHPLRLPVLSPSQLNQLFLVHTPDFEVLQASSADRIGTVVASAGQPELDLSQPTIYVHTSYAWIDTAYHLQLNYTIWLPERPKVHGLDLYGGRWNGITWRVTLDRSGQPLWYDSIHNCGCYHQVWKPDHWVVHQDIGPEQPLFFAHDWVGRPRITLLPGTHYVRWVDAADRPSENRIASVATSKLTVYQQLMAIPDSEGAIALFAPNGFISGSERLERLVLWPFGVQSPGAMRRQGTHAIAFVGKREFADPRLWSNLLTPKVSD